MLNIESLFLHLEPDDFSNESVPVPPSSKCQDKLLNIHGSTTSKKHHPDESKYHSRVCLQRSSSELAIISRPKWEFSKSRKNSKHNLKSVKSRNTVRKSRDNHNNSDRPKTSRESPPPRRTRQRQLYTCKFQLPQNDILDGINDKSRKASPSPKSRCPTPTMLFPQETQPDGTKVAEAVFTSRKCWIKPREKSSTDFVIVGQDSETVIHHEDVPNDDKNLSKLKDEDSLADFCRLEELTKLEKNGTSTTKTSPIFQNEGVRVDKNVKIAETENPLIFQNMVDAEPKNTSERIIFSYEKEWKQALETIKKMEISKKICDSEIQGLRQDLNQASKIIKEKTKLLEKVRPKEGPPWVVPSEENMFRSNIDYFSLRTFNENLRGKTYTAKLYTPGGSGVEEDKGDNEVSFEMADEEDETRQNQIDPTRKSKTKSAPSDRTYLNIRRRQLQFLQTSDQKSPSPSKKNSLQSLRLNRALAVRKGLDEQISKPRSVPLNSKLCSRKHEKLGKSNKFEDIQANSTVSSNPIANMEYLAIALASREGLLREIEHSVKKAKKILHFRFNMLLTSNFSSDDLHFLLTSHRRFLRWLNNYINYSTKLINRFDDKYMKSRRFYLPSTLQLNNEETLKGIFIPLPDHGDNSSTEPENPQFEEKSAQTCSATSVSNKPKFRNAHVQTDKVVLLTHEKSVQIMDIPAKTPAQVNVADKSNLTRLRPRVRECSTQTKHNSMIDESTQNSTTLGAEISTQTKLPQQMDQSMQSEFSLASFPVQDLIKQNFKSTQTQTAAPLALPEPLPSINPKSPVMISIGTQSKLQNFKDNACNTISKINNNNNLIFSTKTVTPEMIISESESIRGSSLQEQSSLPKVSSSTRNVALQNLQKLNHQSPPSPLSSCTIEAVTAAATTSAASPSSSPSPPPPDLAKSLAADHSIAPTPKIKSQPRISLNIQNLADQQISSENPKSKPISSIDRLRVNKKLDTTSKTLINRTSAANFSLGFYDPIKLEKPESSQMEELWNIPMTSTSSIFSENLGQFPEKTLKKEEADVDFISDDQPFNVYEPLDSDRKLKTRSRENPFEQQSKDVNEVCSNVNKLANNVSQVSPFHLVSEFHEETAERFYNHRGNVNLRVLDEDKILFPESDRLGVIERRESDSPIQRSPYKSNVPGSTIEELTNFFEETVIKFKQKQKSIGDLQDPLPKFKTTAEVVLDILSEGQHELYHIQSDESFTDPGSMVSEHPARFISLSPKDSDILSANDSEVLDHGSDSEILDIDPEYENMFNLAARDIANVDEEFSKIWEHHELQESKDEEVSPQRGRQEQELEKNQLAGDKLREVPQPTKETPNNKSREHKDPHVLDQSQGNRTSRLPVRVTPPRDLIVKPGVQKLNPISPRIKPGILQQPVKQNLASMIPQAGQPKSDDISSTRGRRSLIPVIHKTTTKPQDGVPALVQAHVKRFEKVTSRPGSAQPQGSIFEQKMTSTVGVKREESSSRRASMVSYPDRAYPVVGEMKKRKPATNIWNVYKKSK